MEIKSFKKKEVLYSSSIQLLKEKLANRISIGYVLIGDIKMGMDGKWACFVEKEIVLKERN